MNDLMEQACWLMTAEAMWDSEVTSETSDATKSAPEAAEDAVPLFI